MNRLFAIEAVGIVLLIALGQSSAQWTPVWDSTILAAAVTEQGKAYDEKAGMIKGHVGPEYRYHTNLRDQDVHPTRDSFRYALLLLAQGGEKNRARAVTILSKLLSLQDTISSSNWYGLWGYYLEEPASKMSPADWNWADFNTATLLRVFHQHRARLPQPLVGKIQRAILHGARSVMRRNVDMNYTNIAVMGTYVTLASGELLNDKELWSYSTERLRRLAQTIDQSGSFFEYNSPTYGWVSISHLCELRMFVRDSLVRARAERIRYRVWQQFAEHWHVSTRQLAGPMCRAYSTDIGTPVWLQKSLDNRLRFVSLEDLRAGKTSSDVALIDVRCPADLAPRFLESGPIRLCREAFSPGDVYPYPFFAESTFAPGTRSSPVRPVQGTTYLTPFLSLGSVNRSDFWVQRRPILAYWGDTTRPVNYLQVRFVKDDYDFASAMLYSTQKDDCVLGAVAFRSEGGDKHLTLDPVRGGAITAKRLCLQFIVNGVDSVSKVLVGGTAVPSADTARQFTATSRVVLQSRGAQVLIDPRYTKFGGHRASMVVRRSPEGQILVNLVLMKSDTAVRIAWSDVDTALAAFRVQVRKSSGTLAQYDAQCAKQSWNVSGGKGTVRFDWNAPCGKLQVTAGVRPQPVTRLDELFDELIDGKPAPVVRLSEEKLSW